LLTLRPNSFSGAATSLSAFIFSAEVVLKKKRNFSDEKCINLKNELTRLNFKVLSFINLKLTLAFSSMAFQYLMQQYSVIFPPDKTLLTIVTIINVGYMHSTFFSEGIWMSFWDDCESRGVASPQAAHSCIIAAAQQR